MSQWQQQVDRCPAPAEVLLACEGELPFAQGQRVLGHLSRCEACGERLATHQAGLAMVTSYSLSLDADRPGLKRFGEFEQNLRDVKQTRAMHLRDGWGSRRVMTAAAVILIVVTSMALPSAHAAGGIGGIFSGIAAVVRHVLNFEPAGGGRAQVRKISKSERTPALPAPAPASAEPVETAETRQPPATAINALPDRDTLDQAELDARLVLSDASLDLLRGIHVSSTPKAVRVEGVIPAPRRRVVARLNALPYVRVSLRAGPAVAGNSAAAGGGTGAGGAAGAKAPVTGLSRWVDYRLGDRPERQTFVPELARLATAVTERVYTLNGLAERYSDDAVKDMSPAARAKLQKLLDRHYQLLSNDLDALDARFAILFGSTTRVFPARRAPSDWQQRVNSGAGHAESLDRSLRDLLTLDDLPPVPGDDDMPEGRAVTAAFGALWDAVHAARP